MVDEDDMMEQEVRENMCLQSSLIIVFLMIIIILIDYNRLTTWKQNYLNVI